MVTKFAEIVTTCAVSYFYKYVTVTDAESMRLVIHGLNRKFHFAGESHAYTCVLEGVLLPQTALERYKPRWKSMLPGSHVTEEQNVIRILSDSTKGLHNYRCYYKQNGLDLFEDIIFLIAGKIELKCMDGPSKMIRNNKSLN